MRNMIVASGLAVACLAGCGSSGGACVEANSICHNGFAESECNILSPYTFYAGQTCAQVGYTQACSSGNNNCYCRTGYQYCP